MGIFLTKWHQFKAWLVDDKNTNVWKIQEHIQNGSCQKPTSHVPLYTRALVPLSTRMIEAKDIVRRISKRELYKTVGHIECSGNQQISLDNAQMNLQNIVGSDSRLDRNDMAILRKRVSCGMGRKNPVEKVLFIDKRGKTRTFTSELLRKNLPRELSTVTYIFVVKKIIGFHGLGMDSRNWLKPKHVSPTVGNKFMECSFGTLLLGTWALKEEISSQKIILKRK